MSNSLHFANSCLTNQAASPAFGQDTTTANIARRRIDSASPHDRADKPRCRNADIMSKTVEERVDYALNQLIERVVPEYADDDEEEYDHRLDEAYSVAREILGRCGT